MCGTTQHETAMAKPFGSSLTNNLMGLSLDQWEAIKTLFPVQRTRLHHPRRILDALLYLVKTGCVGRISVRWRYLPDSFPPWTAVYYHFRRWKATGSLRRAHDAIRSIVRTRKGRKAAASLGLLDSQSVKTTMLGGVRGFDAGKRLADASGTCSLTRWASSSHLWCIRRRSRTDVAAWTCFGASHHHSACGACSPTRATHPCLGAWCCDFSDGSPMWSGAAARGSR